MRHRSTLTDLRTKRMSSLEKMVDDFPTQERTLAASFKLYYDLHIPADVSVERPFLIALHGYGANKRQMMREARSIAPPDFAVASLQGFHQHLRDPKEKGG